MLGVAPGAVLFAPAEDAFDHRAARLRHAVALMARGACVDGALATSGAGAVELRHMRCDVEGAQLGDMFGGVIGLVLTGRDVPAGLLGFGSAHRLRSAALGGV